MWGLAFGSALCNHETAFRWALGAGGQNDCQVWEEGEAPSPSKEVGGRWGQGEAILCCNLSGRDTEFFTGHEVCLMLVLTFPRFCKTLKSIDFLCLLMDVFVNLLIILPSLGQEGTCT